MDDNTPLNSSLLKVEPPAEASEVSSTTDRNFIQCHDFNFFYGTAHVLHDINFGMGQREVTALIGPSGCGKTTLLRSINRMNDLIEGVHHTGDIIVNRNSVYDPHLEVIALRKRIGMVF